MEDTKRSTPINTMPRPITSCISKGFTTAGCVEVVTYGKNGEMTAKVIPSNNKKGRMMESMKEEMNEKHEY